jgi:hypothetical protein
MTPAYKSLGRRPRAEVLIQREHSVEHGLDAAQMDLLLPLGGNSMAVKILGHDVVDAESANHIRKLMHLRRKALQQGGVPTWSRKRGLARVVGVSHGESPSLGLDQHRHAPGLGLIDLAPQRAQQEGAQHGREHSACPTLPFASRRFDGFRTHRKSYVLLGQAPSTTKARVNRRRGIRSHLFQVQLVGIVPIGLFAAALLYFHWQAQEHERQRSQMETVRLLAAAADVSLDSTVERLSIFARLWSSSWLSEQSVRAQAKEALGANADWSSIVAFDPAGHLLAKQGQPDGAVAGLIDRNFKFVARSRSSPADQYDFGRPSTFSAMKHMMSCELTGARRAIITSRK